MIMFLSWTSDQQKSATDHPLAKVPGCMLDIIPPFIVDSKVVGLVQICPLPLAGGRTCIDWLRHVPEPRAGRMQRAPHGRPPARSQAS